MEPSPIGASDHPSAGLLGESSIIRTLRSQIQRLAGFDTVGNPFVPTLLLQGETGTGKGLVARLIHESGPRARGPFIEVNCAAIPEMLLEAEVFGFEAGAFTDAKRPKPGLLEAAEEGTLLLDEIDTLPLLLQSKLLTAIESKRVRRVGAVAEHAVDVKVMAATQADLNALVAAGQFRADLYYRLAVVLLEVPPLRARGTDVLLLAEHFLHRYAAAHGLMPKRLSGAAADWLCAYTWPGNVRELSHLMERVTLLSSESLLAADTLEQLCLPRPSSADHMALLPESEESGNLDERTQLLQALDHTEGNVLRAARLLGLSRSAIRHRLRRYGIEPPRRARAPQHQHPTGSTARQPAERPRVTSVGAAALAPTLEQKLVALLAIDLTFPPQPGSTTAEYDLWTVTNHWEQTLVEKVQGFEGVLVQRFASLCLVAFGMTHVLEQLPQRAVQAALAIRQVVAAAQDRIGQAPVPEIRQAIHLGPLLVEGAARTPAARSFAVGETSSVPIRLLGHAAPGEILVSPPVGRLLAGLCELQARPMWGGAAQHAQEDVYSVMGLVSRHALLTDLRAPLLSQFVGRERELTMLHDLLGQVTEGRGQVVRLVGEPGVGKSRLLYEFRRGLLGQPVTYLEGRCLSYGSAIPYGPVLGLLRDNCGITETESPEVITAKVRLSLQEVGLDPVQGAPYLLHLLGVLDGTETVASLRPETVKARTFATLLQIFLRRGQQQPLILAIEDLQWIDPTSNDFLMALVEQLAGVPIFLLTTARPSTPVSWLRKSYATQIALAPLTSQESLRLVHATFHTELVPAALVQRLLAQAEGNPLFLEELMQGLVEQGVCIRTPEGRVTLTEAWRTRPLTAVQLPPTVQGVLTARIDRLPAEAKALLQTLAVIGPMCSWQLLQRVVEAPDAALHQRLGALQEAELLYERPAVPEPEYVFKHALTQEVAYTALPQTRRWQVHERTAQAIEDLFHHRLEEHYSELAYHYSHSQNTTKAVDYLQQAGRQTVQRAALEEAISHLTQALTLLTSLPSIPERTRQELDVLVTLGPALMATRGYAAPEVEHTYARARELCGLVEETPQLFPVLLRLMLFYLQRAAFQTAWELSEQCHSLAQRLQDPMRLLEAHHGSGTVLFWRGALTQAQASFEEGLRLYAVAQHSPSSLHRQGPGITCLTYAALSLWLLGYPDQALHRSQEALTLVHTVSRPFLLAYTLTGVVLLHQLRREASHVQAQAEAIITVSREEGFPYFLAIGTLFRGWALARQGLAEEGLAQLHQGLATYRTTGAKMAQSYLLTFLAEAYGAGGHPEAGLQVLDEALAAVRDTGERMYEAELRSVPSK
jgi:DNA-binding NtrC family response regulator/predicted ATPase